MIGYAADTSKWEDWQRDYRLGLIMPPPEVSRQIDPLRAMYDPRAYAICPTHISVSDPLRREMTPQVEHEIRTILNSIVIGWSSLFPMPSFIFRDSSLFPWARPVGAKVCPDRPSEATP